jgi:hypothetical protein
MQPATWRTLLKDVKLMSQYQDLGPQPLSRLEAVAQQADEKEANGKHSAIMF